MPKPRPPLDPGLLAELAAGYAARYATTRLKLSRYLAAKLRTRGWNAPEPPEIAKIIDRLAAAGALSDEVWADGRAETLRRRGMGAGRVRADLGAGGIGREAAAAAAARGDPLEAARAYARRRRLGVYHQGARDRDGMRRDMGAMLRAGHAFDVARQALGADPDALDPPD